MSVCPSHVCLYVTSVHTFVCPHVCPPAVDCGILVPPLFGQVVTTDGSTFGSVATYICDEGHTLDGSSTRTCLTGAEWTGEAPLCIRKWPEEGMALAGLSHILWGQKGEIDTDYALLSFVSSCSFPSSY